MSHTYAPSFNPNDDCPVCLQAMYSDSKLGTVFTPDGRRLLAHWDCRIVRLGTRDWNPPTEEN